MHFRLVIDNKAEENITATVKHRTRLVDEIEMLCLKDEGIEHIVGYRNDEIKMINFSDIECITVIDGKTVAIDLINNVYRIKQRLYQIESNLPSQFVKINKSSIANENRIEKFMVSFGGAVDVVFKCGYKDTVSRRCFKQLRKRFEL